MDYKVKIINKRTKRVILNYTDLNKSGLNNHIVTLTKDIIYLVNKKQLDTAVYENNGLKWKIRKIDI